MEIFTLADDQSISLARSLIPPPCTGNLKEWQLVLREADPVSALRILQHLEDPDRPLLWGDRNLVENKLQIPWNWSYQTAILLEEEMRAQMYQPGFENSVYHTNPTYGLLNWKDWKSQIFGVSAWTSLDALPDVLTLNDFPSLSSLKDTLLEFEEDDPKTYLQGRRCMIAGGCILSKLLGMKSSDIDLFAITKNETLANKIVYDLCKKISYGDCSRTRNAVSFTHLKTQIILRLYSTPSEVLHGFDVDCCAIGYWNGNYWLTRRAAYALSKGYNTLNLARASPSYEHRLLKYMSRGIALRLPKFDKNRILVDAVHREGGNYMSTYNSKLLSLKMLDLILYAYVWAKYDHDAGTFISRKSHKMRRLQGVSVLSDYHPFEIRQPNFVSLLYLLKYVYQTLDKYLHREILFDLFHMVRQRILFSEEQYDKSENSLPSEIAHEIEIKFLTEAQRADLNNPFPYDLKKELDEIAVPIFRRGTSKTWCIEYDIDNPISANTYRVLSFIRPWDVPYQIEWKKTNPGEQMTGTFHKLTLEKPETWWSTRFYA